MRLWLHARVRRQGRVHHPHRRVWRRREWWDAWWDGWRDYTSPPSQSRPWEHRRANHFLSIYFFSILAFGQCSKFKSNKNHPDLADFGRAAQFQVKTFILDDFCGRRVLPIDLYQPFVNPIVHLVFSDPFTNQVAHHRQFVTTIITVNNTAFLFGKSSSNSHAPTPLENQPLAIDLNLVSPTTSRLATWVTNSNPNEIQNDFKYYALNEDKTHAFNRKAISLPTQARQDIYTMAPWKVGLHDDDLHVSLGDLQIPQGTKRYSMTEANEPIKRIKQTLKTHRDFFVFPPNDKRNAPPNYLSSNIWSKAIKNALVELKKEDEEKSYTGWITMESWERHTMAKNHLLFAAGPLIDLKQWVDKVVVHHGTRPLLPTRAFSLRDGYIPQRPYVSIHINTSKKVDNEINFRDLNYRGQDLQLALNTIQVNKTIAAVDITLRIDVYKDILFK